MPTFSYSGYDTAGRARKGLVDALDPSAARRSLAQEGILPARLAPATTSSRASFPTAGRTAFYRSLSALLASAIPLVPALDVLLAGPPHPPHRAALAAIRDRVREGEPLSAALQHAVPSLTAYETSVLQVGERTGGMADALSKLAGFLEGQAALRSRLLSALLYPAVVATLAVLLGGGVLTFLLPRVQTLFAQARLPESRFTAFLLSGGRVAGVFLLASAALASGLGFAARCRARRSEAFRIRLERSLARAPFLGRAWRSLATLRFARVLSLLLSRRVGLLEAVPLAARASGSTAMARDSEDAAERIRQGERLADALGSMPLLHESLASWMRAGEAAGSLVALLDHAGDRLEAEHDRRAGRGVLAMEVFLTLAVGAGVALVALAVLLPILQINQGFTP